MQEYLVPYNEHSSVSLTYKDFFKALEGDVRVKGDTIVVTYYNAPNCNLLRNHFESLPEKLLAEGVNPTIPWLYGFKLGFRFK